MPDHSWILPNNLELIDMDLPILSVVGLGKLGAPMAAVFACAGYQVYCTDKNARLVDLLSSGEAPCEETDLATYIERAGHRLLPKLHTREAVLGSDVTFVIVPTPTDSDGGFSNEYLKAALKEVGQALFGKSAYHLVVITSTVVPGAIDSELLRVLEDASAKKVGQQIGLCYSPEFIALGSVIRDMENPDLVLIGQSDSVAGNMLQSVYERVCQNQPAYKRMNFVNAELAKIAINTFVTTKISYANMLSALCDKLPGADVDVVSDTLGADSRIGHKYLKGGTAYGGPCFPRDNKAFAAIADKLGVTAHIAQSTDATNRDQTQRLVKRMEAFADRPTTVSILGLSYKPDTTVVEESAGVMLAKALVKGGYTVTAHDPVVTQEVTGLCIEASNNIYDVLQAAEVIFIMTPWNEYTHLPKLLENCKRSIIIVDPWRIFSGIDFCTNITYVALGRG